MYTVDGVQYPSVTTIIRFMGAPQELMYWYGKLGLAEANRVTEASSNYGKALHKACDEAIFKKSENPLDPDFVPRVQLVKDWITSRNFTPIYGEQTIYNSELSYAGTCDGILQSGTGIVVIDFKTGREHRFEEVLQLAAYANCPMVQANAGYIIRMGKESTFVPQFTRYDKNELAVGFEMFKKMLELYHYKKSLSKKRREKTNEIERHEV